MPFTRDELQRVRGIALTESRLDGTANIWSLAYRQLAVAADHLDAMMARTELPNVPITMTRADAIELFKCGVMGVEDVCRLFGIQEPKK